MEAQEVITGGKKPGRPELKIVKIPERKGA
jgi:hypothetical protein